MFPNGSAATVTPSDKIHMHGSNAHTKDDKHFNKKMVMKNLISTGRRSMFMTQASSQIETAWVIVSTRAELGLRT